MFGTLPGGSKPTGAPSSAPSGSTPPPVLASAMTAADSSAFQHALFNGYGYPLDPKGTPQLGNAINNWQNSHSDTKLSYPASTPAATTMSPLMNTSLGMGAAVGAGILGADAISRASDANKNTWNDAQNSRGRLHDLQEKLYSTKEGPARADLIRRQMSMDKQAGIFGGYRAFGGPVTPDQSYVVGENGPEVFQPPTDGDIIPNSDTAETMGEPALPLGQADTAVEQVKQKLADTRTKKTQAALEHVLSAPEAEKPALRALLQSILNALGGPGKPAEKPTPKPATPVAGKEGKAKLPDTQALLHSMLNSKLGTKHLAGARAAGGPVQAKQNYLVGEMGMEHFMPKQLGGSVYAKPLAAVPYQPNNEFKKLQYALTPQLKQILSKEAPETLVAPKPSQFVNPDFYNQALKNYVQNGHWATPDPTNLKEMALYKDSQLPTPNTGTFTYADTNTVGNPNGTVFKRSLSTPPAPQPPAPHY